MVEDTAALLRHCQGMRDDLLSAIAGLSGHLMTEPSLDGWSVLVPFLKGSRAVKVKHEEELMKKSFILSALAGAIAVLILFLVTSLLSYADFLENNSALSADLFEKVQRPLDQTQIPAIILSIVIIGCLIATIVYWVKAKKFVDGFKYVFLFGVLMMGSVNFGLIATTYYYSYTTGIVDIFVSGLMFGIGGGVAALVMGKRLKPAKP